MVSLREGKPVVAQAQLSECLGILQGALSNGAGSVALDAAAELAWAVGELELAVEFHGACERTRPTTRAPEDSEARRRSERLDQLLCQLGGERFAERWSASQATPVPLPFYVSRSIDWLRDLEPRLRRRGHEPGVEAPGIPTAAGTTARLIVGAREGHSSALSRLAARALEPLRQFAHGRLPARARDLLDTDDLVQNTLVRGLDKVDGLESPRKGRFFAYLRAVLINQVRDEIRRAARRPRSVELNEALVSEEPSPLEGLLRREAFELYRAELDRLPPESRRAVMLRVQMGYSYPEIATAIGCEPDAARMRVTRSLERMAASLKRAPR